MKDYDKILCDRCNNFSQSPSGCCEGCSEHLSNPFWMTMIPLRYNLFISFVLSTFQDEK